MAPTYIETDIKNKELRLAYISNTDTEYWTIHFVHVKGRDSYSIERTIPFMVELRPIVEQYLFDRAMCLGLTRSCPRRRPSPWVATVCEVCEVRHREEIGKSFEIESYRIVCGQLYIDKGIELKDLSMLMGIERRRHPRFAIAESTAIKKTKNL